MNCYPRSLLVFWLIVYSVRFGTRPWNFFQLNSIYFNNDKGFFSKLDIDRLIPDRWRLVQQLDDGASIPEFPVFSKPEWGQNSHGVRVIRDEGELREVRRTRKGRAVSYLLQEAAKEKREFEVFYLRSPADLEQCAMLSITETLNSSGSSLPVNGVLNSSTLYREIGSMLSTGQKKRIWSMVSQIGEFRVARVGLCADSVEDLAAGNFHIFEINIFLPMPLLLLDATISCARRWAFIRESMRIAALLAKNRDRGPARYPVFAKHFLAHYRVKS